MSARLPFDVCPKCDGCGVIERSDVALPADVTYSYTGEMRGRCTGYTRSGNRCRIYFGYLSLAGDQPVYLTCDLHVDQAGLGIGLHNVFAGTATD